MSCWSVRFFAGKTALAMKRSCYFPAKIEQTNKTCFTTKLADGCRSVKRIQNLISTAKLTADWAPDHGHTIHKFATSRTEQNGRYFPDDIFKWIFLNGNISISIKISLKFVPRGPMNNIPALVQMLTWRRSGDKPLSEPMMARQL